MLLRLIEKDFLTYGVLALRGKAVAAFLLLASPVWAEPVTVLALGDSLTQGYGLPEDQGFVPQLEKWLTGQGVEARLINGGVSGDTTAGGAARVAWSLTPEVDAMIVTLGGNDVLRGIDPGVSRANLDKILSVAGDKGVRVLLVGMPAPGNFGPDYQQDFDAIYSDLSEVHQTLHYDSIFEGLGGGTLAESQAYFQSDGIHPNAEGVKKIVAAMGPAVIELIKTVQQASN